MKALEWHGTHDIRVETAPDPLILNPRDAIVRITLTAICGSDLHLYDGYIPTTEKGDILGHEFMGEVVETGSAITSLTKGRPRGRRFPHLLRHVLSLHAPGICALRQLQSQRRHGTEVLGPFPGRHLRLLASARRLSRAARRSMSASPMPTWARSRSPRG